MARFHRVYELFSKGARVCNCNNVKRYRPSDAAPPAKSNMAARGPQNGRRSLERGVTLVYWPFQATFVK